MLRGKIHPALVLFFLALGVLAPRPAPGLSISAGEPRVAGQGGDAGMIVSPRPPRRRIQPPAVSIPLQAIPTSPSARYRPAPGRVPAVPDRIPLSVRPSSGAGVTRAGPSILF